MVFASLHERGLLYMHVPHQHANSTPPFRKVWLRACIQASIRKVRFIFYSILFEQNSILICSSDRRGGGETKHSSYIIKKAIPVFHSSCPFHCSSPVNGYTPPIGGVPDPHITRPPPTIDDSEDDPDYTTGNFIERASHY